MIFASMSKFHDYYLNSVLNVKGSEALLCDFENFIEGSL